MQISEAIIKFGRQYLAAQISPAEHAHLKTLPLAYVTDLYTEKFSYDAISGHLDAFLRVALTYKQADRDRRQRINEIFRQADIIRGEGHTRTENKLSLLVAVYLGAEANLAAAGHGKLYSEQYETHEASVRLLHDVENDRMEFLAGWAFCAAYVLDTLNLVVYYGSLTHADAELTIEQQVWFEELTTWFKNLYTLTCEVNA